MSPISLDLMPLEEKPPEAPPPKTMVVRYGFLKEIGEFVSDLTGKVGCGTKLVIRTDRGTELAEMLTTTCGNGGCNKSITRDKLLSYIEESGGRDYPFSEQGRILRVATAQDLAEQAKLDENHKKHLTLARELVATHKLSMKIVDVEHVLGGERILFYFVSEHRIDFRSLVRDMAQVLHTRIEMRQVGARDEARLTADYEKCGQHCCCKQFLKVLTPISMRSAKVQKATLDPTKISGRCGRLMCCLRYEDETYEELRKKLPKRNTRVRTEAGDGWVIDGQILTQLVLIQFDDGKREAVPMEKILEFDRPKPLMADGRIMQTANDRPPMAPMGPATGPVGRQRGPGGPPAPGGPGAGGPRRERPKPGAPANGPDGDPRALTGPTGGDLNVAPETPDELDDLIADAMDDQPVPTAAQPAGPEGPQASIPPTTGAAPGSDTTEDLGDERALPPQLPPQNQPRPMPPRGPGGPPGQGQRPPQNRQGFGQQQRGPRPPQGPNQRGGGQRPPQQRGPQGFRPPNQQSPGGKPRGPGNPNQGPLPRRDNPLPPPPAEGSTGGPGHQPPAPPQAAPPPPPPATGGVDSTPNSTGEPT